jgi:CheY-like chemotaxis protein
MNNQLLLIDDEEVFNLIHSTLINHLDKATEIIKYTSSMDALNFVTNCMIYNIPLPAIMFIDIRMPEMNGFELLDEFMKMGPDTFANTRIYVVTSSLNEKDRIKSMGYPIVTGFKEKMMDKDQILEILKLKEAIIKPS